MYQKILVAVDGSTASNRAISAALEMAMYSRGDSVVRLLHAIDEMAYFTGLDSYAGPSTSMIDMMRKAGERILADGIAIMQSAGVRGEAVLIDQLGSHLAEAVAAQIKSWDANVVVVGTHGRKGIKRAVLGSDAEKIIRLSPCPVLVVRDTAPA